MKKVLSILTAAICITACAFSFTACGDNTENNTHTSHNWSATYTQDGDRHYQTCDGCTEKNYSEHDYGTSGTCVCGKTKPETPVAITGVTLNKNTLALEVDGTETLIATVAPDNATNKNVSWESDKTNIATVDNTGKVTAVAEGTAIITAKTANNKTAQCTVTVNAAVVPVTGVTLNKDTLTLEVDGTETLTATVAPDNATDKNVTYSVEPAGVVTVDNNGNVTAVADGTATITATAANNKTATCEVTVSAPITNAQVIEALDRNYKYATSNKLFEGLVEVEQSKVYNGKWYVTQNADKKITNAEYTFNYNAGTVNNSFALIKVVFKTPMDVKDLINDNVSDATYATIYNISYNPTIQETRKDLTDAICNKIFETNGTVQNCYIVDRGAALEDPKVSGTVREFKVIEVTDKGVQEANVNIKTSDSDAGYIEKLNDESNYRVYDESSKAITGMLLENNNERF